MLENIIDVLLIQYKANELHEIKHFERTYGVWEIIIKYFANKKESALVLIDQNFIV